MSNAKWIVAVTVLGWGLSVLADEKPGEAARSYRVLAADRGRVAIVDAKGKVEWKAPVKAEVHDIAMLANGNILFTTSPTTIVEMSPDHKIVWQYVSKPEDGYKGAVEIHAFQRWPAGSPWSPRAAIAASSKWTRTTRSSTKFR